MAFAEKDDRIKTKGGSDPWVSPQIAGIDEILFWIMINIKGSPLEATAPDYTRTIIILTLEESGNVILSEIDFKGEKVETNTPMVCGEWKKNGSEYSISIISTGTVRAFINKELLHIDLYNSGIYFGLRKMEPLDLYTDISR